MTQQPSRRSVLKAASLGAAAAGVAAAVPGALAGSAEATGRTPDGPRRSGPVVVAVGDVRTGEITVMSGEHEFVHHDRDLARRLARLASA